MNAVPSPVVHTGGSSPGTDTRPAVAFAAFLLAVAALVAGVPAAAQTVDSSLWVPNGTVYALAKDGNTLYLGGSFTELAMATGGGVPLSPADALPAGPFPRVLGDVHTVIADGSVAPWAPNPNGRVQALALNGGSLYVGGEFTWIGMRWRNRIARLDLTSGVATSWNPGSDAGVLAMALSGNKLYVGGAFLSIAGAARSRIAAFEVGPDTLTAWNPGANGVVRAFAPAGDTLLVGGDFFTIGGSPRQFLAALEPATGLATSWNPNPNSIVFALAVSGGTIFVGGDFSSMGGQSRRYLAAVDRVSGVLRPFESNATHAVLALAVSGNTLYAGGNFLAIGGSPRRGLAALDATTAMALPWNPNPDAGVRALAVQGSVVYTGGFFRTIGGIERMNIAALDLLSGYPTPWNPRAGSQVFALAVSGGAVYAGGDFTSIGGATRDRIAALDIVTGVATSWAPGANAVVRALAVGGGRVYAGGDFTSIGGASRNRIAELDMTSGYATPWSPGTTAGSVHALVVDGGLVYAGGGFSYIGGEARTNLAAISVATGLATAWRPNPNATVYALAPSGGTIYAGGSFSQIGGSVRANLAALDTGTGWATPWNPGTNGAVKSLALSGGTVYAGGTFDLAAGQSRQRIAALDATTGTATVWNANADYWVEALAAGDGAVYAGGGFRTIGGEPQRYLAAIGLDVPAPAADPTFTTNVTLSAVNIAVGETVTITTSVRNDGADSDDGRIVFSFKDLTDPLDAGRVTSPSAGATPGYRTFPRGTTLLGRDCQPVTASYLVAEYAEADWRGFGAETHTFTVTARPRTAGVFSIDVRATLGTAGGAPCDYASEMPPDGDTYITDQQGWSVRRFIVYVTGTPALADPVIGGVSLSAQSITLGQALTLTTGVSNAGAISDDGRIVLSFPSLTGPLDATRAWSMSGDDLPGFRRWIAGTALADTACRPVVTPCLVAEYADSVWQPIGHETNPLVVNIQPREVGSFHIDVRATMRTAGGDSCGYVNALPPNGQAGFFDPQGWPVKRFTVTVVAPPVAADPDFFDPVYVSADSIVLGQTLSITAFVRNRGLASDDGRIVYSFPALTHALDVARVTSSASGDYPGFCVLPAGTALLGHDCAPVTASYLVAEYADNDWLWLGGEENTFTAIVTPREAGDFIVDVRSTMRTAGGAACDYVNDVPPNGQAGFTDQQGWSVRRFVVRVKPAPPTVLPVFTELVGISATVVQLGQPVVLTARVRNDGLRSDDGRIVFSFPDLSAAGDSTRVTSSSQGDSPGFDVFPVGSQRPGVDCQPVTLPCLVAEYADNDWGWLGSELNTFILTVYPREVGTFTFDVRTTLRTAGAGACDYVNALPPNGVDGSTDPQGWAVRRFTITVSAVPPNPVFLDQVSVSPAAINLGQPVTITASVRNNGAPSDDGRVVFSFPGLTDPLDALRVTGPAAGDAPGFRTLPVGSPLVDADCQPMTAGYLVAEYVDADWEGFYAETNPVTLTVRPRHAGTFVIEVRASLHEAGPDPCAIATATPPNGQEGGFDQQGWAVRRFFVTVNGPPTIADPAFVGDVVVSTDVMPLGDALTITATVRNDGALSDDGRIVVSFPALDDPADGQWVSGAGSGDTPGYRVFPAGATLPGHDCQPVTASYLVAEYADAAWDSIADETNTLTLTVRPPRQGLFTVEVRSTMRTADAGACDYVNDVPPNGQGGFTDQQGWAVRRFEVLVGSPASMTWRQLGTVGSGPNARSAQAAVYDAARDELVLYGGTALSYFADSWALPLDGGSSWSPLSPGGPVPLVRIMHSMVFNPVENHLVIFGGYYDHELNDLWILTRSPTTWWFPIDVPGVKPSPRYGHAAVYDPVRQRMLVIGGFDGGLRNDVWEYSPMVNGTWRLLTPTGTPMPPRATHSVVYDPVRDRVLVFGGDGGLFLNDVWELRLAGGPAWARLTPAGAPPSPRREHTAIVDVQRDQMVVFGGYDGTRRVNDVWTLSLSGAPTWERRFSSTTSPSGRNLHSAVYDPIRGRMVVFGGQLGINSYSNEVWELTLDESTPVGVAFAGAEADLEGVSLTWHGAGAATLVASVERRTVEGDWQVLGAASADGAGHLAYRDEQVTPGTRYGYRLRIWLDAVEEVLEPVWVTVPARPELALAGARPNPARDLLAVAFTLPGRGAGALELFDLRGALVARHELAGLEAGPHRVTLAEGRRLAAGIYLVRLTHGGRTLTSKACVVR